MTSLQERLIAHARVLRHQNLLPPAKRDKVALQRVKDFIQDARLELKEPRGKA